MVEGNLLENIKKSIQDKKLIASRIKIFAGIIVDTTKDGKKEKKVLLRKNKNELKEEWELPGEEIRTDDELPGCPYNGAILDALDKGLRKKMCLALNLLDDNQLVLLPAWRIEPGIVCLGFVAPLELSSVYPSHEFGEYFFSIREGFDRKLVEYFNQEEISSMVTSPMMKYMIEVLFHYCENREE